MVGEWHFGDWHYFICSTKQRGDRFTQSLLAINTQRSTIFVSQAPVRHFAVYAK